jgi:DNA-directed RNA polymerase subunit beta'
MQLEKEAANLREDSLNTKSQTKLKKYNKRLKLIDSLIQSGNKPEWMVLNAIFNNISVISRRLVLLVEKT